MAYQSSWKLFSVNSDQFQALRTAWQPEAWKKYQVVFGKDGRIETNLPHSEFRQWFKAIKKPVPKFVSQAHPSWESPPAEIERNESYVTPADIARTLGFSNETPVLRYCRKGAIPAVKEKRAWFIKKEDAQDFIEKYQAGGIARKGFANPKHPLNASGLVGVLEPKERLTILNYHASLKNNDPANFESTLELYKEKTGQNGT